MNYNNVDIMNLMNVVIHLKVLHFQNLVQTNYTSFKEILCMVVLTKKFNTLIQIIWFDSDNVQLKIIILFFILIMSRA